MPRWLIKNGLVSALTTLFVASGFAATDAEIKLIESAVRNQYPSFDKYCTLADDVRRQVVIQTTFKLMATHKIADPAGAGAAAGVALRSACGIQNPTIAVQSLRWLVTAKPLVFESGFKSLGALTPVTNMGNQIFIPDGYKPSDGLLPAVVINHTIGGLSAHLKVHAKSLLEAGYAVLVVDSYRSRNLQRGSTALPPSDVAKDAYDALAHLSAQSYINKNRIFQIGFSLGAAASALLASPDSAIHLKSPERFRASVLNYSGCTASDGKLDLLSPDSDRPILLLLAGLDNETPPKLCFPRLDEMKAAGRPVQWHIYPNASHAWDQQESHGYSFRTASGETVNYRYDEVVTKDAMSRTLAFLNALQ